MSKGRLSIQQQSLVILTPDWRHPSAHVEPNAEAVFIPMVVATTTIVAVPGQQCSVFLDLGHLDVALLRQLVPVSGQDHLYPTWASGQSHCPRSAAFQLLSLFERSYSPVFAWREASTQTYSE